MASSALANLAPAIAGHVSTQKRFNIDKDEVTFPLVLTPGPGDVASQSVTCFQSTDGVADWVTRNQKILVQLAQTHGAILLRGFCPPVATAADFDTVGKALGLAEFPYIGGAAPRSVITGSVFTANESPADQLIPFHHEMAQSKTHPGTLLFYCMQPPDTGGETPIVLSNLVYTRIKDRFPGFVQELEEKGVRYVRVLSKEDDPTSAIGRGWKSTFAVETKQDAERVSSELGMQVQWLDQDLLRTTTAVIPAVKQDPRTGKTSWFNSIVAAFTGWKDVRNDSHKAVVFGDGSSMNAEILAECRGIMDELAVAFPWERGDILVVDNWVTMHSRKSFTGGRLIYASLWK
ncbi:hypothetical protein BD289DRAFT_452719 [Coniella lustricola]|uniref:TauD/TfdA-like domain-containing protein n=1 Tax=Coniella lustricola TaxID=2025994 RepID=A0A2T3AA99_9PEZI|nr:hypothetical protein BD289DRAFT_452719 [Coniella lustricola]